MILDKVLGERKICGSKVGKQHMSNAIKLVQALISAILERKI